MSTPAQQPEQPPAQAQQPQQPPAQAQQQPAQPQQQPGPAAGPVPPPAPGYAYAPTGAEIPVFPNGKPRLDAMGQPVSPKSRLAAALLCWFLGVFGVHRFYVGKIGTGILMLVTFGGLGVWALIDLIVILVGSFKDKEELRLENW